MSTWSDNFVLVLAVAVSAAAVVLVGSPSPGSACTPGVEYDIEILETDTPSCVSLPTDATFSILIENQCDEKLAVTPTDCEECPDEVVVRQGRAESIDVGSRLQNGESRTYTFDWQLDSERSGQFEVKATNEGIDEDACKDWPGDAGTSGSGDAGDATGMAETGTESDDELDWESGDGESSGCRAVGPASPVTGAGLLAALVFLFLGLARRRRDR